MPRDLWSKPGNPAPDGLIGDFNSQLGHPEQNSAPGGVGAHYGDEKTSWLAMSLFPVESLVHRLIRRHQGQADFASGFNNMTFDPMNHTFVSVRERGRRRIDALRKSEARSVV